jgi:hypothetical protein
MKSPARMYAWNCFRAMACALYGPVAAWSEDHQMRHRERRLDNDQLLLPRSESSGKTRHLNSRLESTGAKAIGASAIGTSAIGSVVIGALAVGALAIGAVAIGRLAIGRARLRRVEIDELIVRRLRITEEVHVPNKFEPEKHDRPAHEIAPFASS